MRSKRRLVDVTAVAAVFALLVGACTQNRVEDSTTTSQPASSFDPGVPTPPPPADIALVLKRPGEPADAQAGVPVPLANSVWSRNDTVRVELWNGGELVDALDLTEPADRVDQLWYWTPPTPGLHGLVARAVDDTGRAATSFPLWVRAIAVDGSPAAQSPGRPALVEVSFGGLQTRIVTTPPPEIEIDEALCVARIRTPKSEGARGIALYAAAFGSPGFVPVGLIEPSGGTATIPIGSSPVMVYSEAFDHDSAQPSAPAMLVPPNPCADRGWAGQLRLEDGVLTGASANAAYLYLSTDDGETWVRVPETDQTFVERRTGGGFDFGPHLRLLPTTEKLQFEAWGWTDGGLVPLGRGSWTRPSPAPFGGHSLAGPPILTGGDLDWVLSPTILAREGLICTYPPQKPVATPTTGVPVSVVGGQASTTVSTAGPIWLLPQECTNWPSGQYSKTFRWTPTPGQTAGVLQVSTKPPPSAASLAYPGLVMTKPLASPNSTPVDVEVDVVAAVAQSTFAKLADSDAVSYDVMLNLGALGSLASGPPTELFNAWPQLFGGKNQVVYLRVLPLMGNQPAPGVSNAVVIDIDDTPPVKPLSAPEPPPSISLTVRMTPPQTPNAAYQRCVRVVSNPFNGKNPEPSTTPDWFIERNKPVPGKDLLATYYLFAEQSAVSYQGGAEVKKGMVPGSTVCAAQLPPPGKDLWDYIVDAVNFVAWVWDMYVSVFEMLKDKVALALAHGTGCVSIAKAAGASHQDAVETCQGIAKTAINVALYSMGVPPTLPSFSDLVEAAKGELTDLIVELAKNAGYDCGDLLQSACDKVLKDLLDQIVDEMQTQATQAAVSATTNGQQWILKIHPGIYVIPEPAGTLSPAIFELDIARSPDPNAPAPPQTCTYTGYVWGSKTNHQWYDYTSGTHRSEPVDGEVMFSKSITVDISDLGPGEKRGAVLILDRIKKWYPTGANPNLPKAPWNLKPETWIFFKVIPPQNAPGELQLILNGTCGGASQVFPVTNNTPTEPWEIPYP